MVKVNNDSIRESSMTLMAELFRRDNRKVISDRLQVSNSYLTLLAKGKRIVTLGMCGDIKQHYPELTPLCLAIQMKKGGLI